MKTLTHPAMMALGAATLCLIVLIAPLVSPSHTAIYHLSGDPKTVFIAVLLNLAAVWLLFTGVFFLARRPGRLQIAIWSSLLLVLPWVLLKNYAMLTEWTIPHRLSMSVLATCLLTLAALPFLWRPSFIAHFERVHRLATTLLGFLSLASLLLLSQLAWFGWEARNLNRPRPLHQRQMASLGSAVRPAKRRVILLLLDELSYQQVYEQRFPGLRLPAFDRMARQSTVFTHTVAPANKTEIAVPALLSGIPVDHVRPSAAGELTVHDATTGDWHPFDAHDTVFEDALNAGYSTAVAGWYNPYCRILPSVLDRCLWSAHSFQVEAAVYRGQTIADEMLVPARRFLEAASSLLHGKNRTRNDVVQAAGLHVADYRELFADADSLLADPSADFVFLHLPVPHPGGIYDRRNSSFTTSGNSSYIDNLALADAYLAHLRHVLEERGEWDSSTIVVMGDHAWRTKLLWENSPLWTDEDQVASHGGQFDDRPACIVKLPDQNEPLKITEPFATVHMRALLDGVMAGRLQKPAELAAWASQQN